MKMRCFWTGFIAVWAIIPMTGARQSVDALLWAVIAAPPGTSPFFYFLLTYGPKKTVIYALLSFFIFTFALMS